MVNAGALRGLRPAHDLSIGSAGQDADYVLTPMQHRRNQTQGAEATATDMHRL
jgi:hypothetical protein